MPNSNSKEWAKVILRGALSELDKEDTEVVDYSWRLGSEFHYTEGKTIHEVNVRMKYPSPREQ